MIMRVFCIALAIICGLEAPTFADRRALDADRSTMTVHVFKSGMFSMFADNHVIRAPLTNGGIDESATPFVEIVVDPSRMQVLDPGLSAKDRADVQQRMLGPEVLDTAEFKEIRFRSTGVEAIDSSHWMVQGNLTLHGQTRPLQVKVAGGAGRYSGSFELRQSDFGIRPISIIGGTVKVKDAIRVEFDVVAADR